MKCRNVTACLKNLCVSVTSVLQFSSTDVLCFKLEARGPNVAPHVMLCGPTERSFVSEDDLSEDELLLKKNSVQCVLPIRPPTSSVFRGILNKYRFR